VGSYRFIQLDVFTDQAFAGNPLAVFPEAEGLTDERMQQIAREMNLSETVFVLPSDKEGALRRLRIFTPSSELPFAGHPIAGTWNCLAREGVVTPPESGNGWAHIKQEVGIGVLPVDIEFKDGAPVRVVMTQGKFEIRGEIEDGHEQADIARALGLSREDLDESLPIQAVSTGNTMLLVPIRSLADLGHCRVNQPLLDEIFARSEVLKGLNGTGCYAFSRETLEISGPATATRGAFAVAFAFLRTSKFHIGPPTSTTLVMPLRMYRAKTSCRCDLIHTTSSLYGRTLLKSAPSGRVNKSAD